MWKRNSWDCLTLQLIEGVIRNLITGTSLALGPVGSGADARFPSRRRRDVEAIDRSRRRRPLHRAKRETEITVSHAITGRPCLPAVALACVSPVGCDQKAPMTLLSNTRYLKAPSFAATRAIWTPSTNHLVTHVSANLIDRRH